MNELEAAQQFLTRKLSEIHDYLPKKYKLTLVARNVGTSPVDADSDIVMSNDETQAVVNTLLDLEKRCGPGEYGKITKAPPRIPA